MSPRKQTAELAEHDPTLTEDEIRDRVRAISSPRRIERSTEDVVREMRRRGGDAAGNVVESGTDV